MRLASNGHQRTADGRFILRRVKGFIQQPGLDLQPHHPLDGLVDLADLQFTLLKRRFHRQDDLLNFSGIRGAAQRCRHADHIRPGCQSPHNSVSRRDVFGNGLHVHRVGDDHAVKAHLAAQQVPQDHAGKGRRNNGFLPVGYGPEGRAVQLGILDVRAHQHADPLIDQRLKWFQLSLPQLVEALFNARQAGMGIAGCVAMPRKMLARSQYPRGFNALHHRDSHARYHLRVRTE